MSRYLDAFLTMLRESKKRSQPDAALAALLAVETRDDVRALLRVLTEHDVGEATVADFRLMVGEPAPVEGSDGTVVRDDVLCIGVTYGGDPFVIDRPGTSNRSAVRRLDHELEWQEFPEAADLDDFLQDLVAHAHERHDETELDDLLDEHPEEEEPNTWERPIDGGALKLASVADPPRLREWVCASDDIVGENFDDDDWKEAFWHGAYAFALKKRDDGYHAGVIDRSSGEPRFRLFAPAVVGDSFPSSFDSEWRRFVVAARGAVYTVDLATCAAACVIAGGAEIVACAWAGEMIALLRAAGKDERVLELWAREGDAWARRAALPCGRCDVLHTFARDRGLAVGIESTEHDPQNRPSLAFFLGVRGTDLRLLGQIEYRLPSMFNHDGTGYIITPWEETIAIRNFDAAYESAFAAGQAPTELK
jgi:hypothetical protein